MVMVMVVLVIAVEVVVVMVVYMYLWQGRSYPFDVCGRAFVSLPMSQRTCGECFSGVVTNLDLLLETVTTKVQLL